MPIENDIPMREAMRYVRSFTRTNNFGTRRDSPYAIFNYGVNYEEAEKCAAGLTEFGFDGTFQYGVSKVCFPHESEWVLKVPLIRGWRVMTTKEAEFMMSVPLKFRRFFPKNVLVPGAVFQEKCRPDVDRFYADSKIAPTLRKLEAELSLIDLHCDNIGFNRRGALKVIDAQTRQTLKRIQEWQQAA